MRVWLVQQIHWLKHLSNAIPPKDQVHEFGATCCGMGHHMRATKDYIAVS
jgi:hypothetical protein